MSKKVLLLTVLLAFTPFIVFGQSSGKLVGVISDKASGEVLPGVNVSLDGTTLGAASDVDGYFVILNVPVGTYDVRASFIGYQDVLVQGVRVSASKTTEVNFALQEAAIEGQAVVITAEKPLVEKHVTQSVSLVTSEDIENIPIRGFNSLVATQNSVVVQDGNIYIRGGRDDEVGYYIDGASSINPLNNTQSLYIIQEAVEELQVLAGGYTAEFGGANAGIIRTELKTGSSDFKATVDFQTDKFADEGEEFLGTHSFRHHNAVATLSGPLVGNKVRFFIAAENAFQGDRTQRFSEAFTLSNLIDEQPANAAYIDTFDTYAYPDGFTPDREEDLWAAQGTLLFDLQPLQVRVSGSYSTRSRQFNTGVGNNTPMLDMLNERYWEQVFTNTLISSKMTYVINPKSFVEGNFSLFNSNREDEDSYFGADWQSWYDSAAVSQATGGAVTYRDAWRPRANYRFNGWNFARNGDPRNAFVHQKQNYISGALNFVTQAGRHHELKIGGDFRRYTLRRFTVQPAAMNQLDVFNVSNIEDVPVASWISNAQPNNYGFDVYGNEADDDAFNADGIQTADAAKNPVFSSFYLQDKIEYNDLIINAGLRYDYFDPQGERLDLDNLVVDQNTNTISQDSWIEQDVFQQVSPRLGFSFPVSERTNFYMQYGKFIQMPELEAMFTGSARYNFEYIGAGLSFQNPSGFGLDPVRTTSYEIGFRQQLSSVAAFDLTGFYRNVKGQVQVDKVSAASRTFNILVNGDFATTKGLEFSMTLRRVQRIQAQLNYTLSQAEGTGSTRTSNVAALERATARPNVVNPLDFAQTHRGSINLDYRYGNNDGGILENFGANVLFTFNSGHPFTFAQSEVGQANAYNSGVDYMNDTRSRRALEEVGSSTTPFNQIFDLRLDKSFNLTNKLGATVYMRVNNLFNTKNVINVYNATGNAEDDGFFFNINEPTRNGYLEAHGEDWVNQYQAINIVNGQSYWDQLGLQLYGNPRQIFFGVKLSY